MLSDAIFDALHSIEKYQTEFPDAYADVADHIELVKTVMASLMGRLDDPFGDEQPRLRDLISEDQKHLWRVTCEANIARWAERLRLLGPVSAEEISSKLHDAIARQEAMLSQKCPDCGVGVGQPYEHVQDYMPNLSCPFCHEDDVDVEQGECHWEGHGLQRRLKCSECGGVWDEHYVLEELDLQPPELDGFDRKRWPQPAVGRNESADDHQPDESGSKVGLRPRRCTQSELAKVGVELLDERGVQLRCCNCGQIWAPDLLAGGRLPRGYWKCPRGLGCN